jgi:hypothetical protein
MKNTSCDVGFLNKYDYHLFILHMITVCTIYLYKHHVSLLVYTHGNYTMNPYYYRTLTLLRCTVS